MHICCMCIITFLCLVSLYFSVFCVFYVFCNFPSVVNEDLIWFDFSHIKLVTCTSSTIDLTTAENRTTYEVISYCTSGQIFNSYHVNYILYKKIQAKLAINCKAWWLSKWRHTDEVSTAKLTNKSINYRNKQRLLPVKIILQAIQTHTA